jgi:hypothetical protein
VADPRHEKLGAVLVDYSARVQEGDAVLIEAPVAAEPLVREVYRSVLRAGAHPLMRIEFGEVEELLMLEASEEQLDWMNPIRYEDIERADVRIVVEAKDRKVSGREMREELREAKTNRSAAVALVVFTPAHAPSGIAPFDVRAGDVYCVLDPAAPDPATLEVAVRLARLLALNSLRETEAEVDSAAIAAALAGIREQLDVIKGLKAQLTSISGAASGVSTGLDRLRDNVIARVVEAEAELAAGPRLTT